jgi:hypothetical protein
MSNSDQYIQDLTDLHLASHQQLRETIAGLDTDALTWTPAPDTSSIGTAIIHMLGAEAEVLRNLLDIPTDRVRDNEFAAQTHEPTYILHLLDNAVADWETLATRLHDNDLETLRPRPNKPIPQSGLYWLARNYGHVREHTAQVMLTKQLYQLQHP